MLIMYKNKLVLSFKCDIHTNTYIAVKLYIRLPYRIIFNIQNSFFMSHKFLTKNFHRGIWCSAQKTTQLRNDRKF